ncbi:hypothetical protein, partial [Flavobacterium sp.]
VLIASLLSTYGFAQDQISFNEMSLSIIQSIAFTSTYDDMIELETSKKLDIKRYKNEDRTEAMYFTLVEKEIKLLYSADKKLIYARTDFDHYTNTVFEKLEENGFKRTDEPITDENVFGPSIWYYNKANYPYEYIISSQMYSNTRDIYIFDKAFGNLKKFM